MKSLGMKKTRSEEDLRHTRLLISQLSTPSEIFLGEVDYRQSAADCSGSYQVGP